MATVTNLAKSERVLSLASGRPATLAPGESRELDLADHPVHDAWVKAGQVRITGSEPVVAVPPTAAVVQPTVTATDDEDLPHERKRRTRGPAEPAHVG